MPVDPIATDRPVTHSIEPNRAAILEVGDEVYPAFEVVVFVFGVDGAPGWSTVFLACPDKHSIKHPPIQFREGGFSVDVLVIGTPAA